MKAKRHVFEAAVTTVAGVNTSSVYHDLGFPNAQQMLIKAQLTSMIFDLIADRDLTQGGAALELGISQRRLSKLMRGEFRAVSEYALLTFLAQLGSNVEIIVSIPTHVRKSGSIAVTVA